jgi:hypothetical protein
MITDFNYWLTGVGWAEAFFSNEKENFRFEFSYLSDPLAELFESLIKLMRGQSDKEKISFLAEPGQHVLIISRQKEDVISVEITWSDSWDSMNDQANNTIDGKKVVYSDIDTVKNFTSVVCAGIDSLLERHTLAEYHEKWHLSAFPIENYNELKQATKWI